MDYKELAQILRNLSPLELDSKQKREIIKGTYGCIGRIYGFPEILNKSVQEAKEKNLIQDEAYRYLVKSISKYDKELTSSLISGSVYNVYSNNIF